MAMKRGHSAFDYKQKVRKLRETRPDISLSSDFIIGFPGETDQDFEYTMGLIEEVGFDHSFSFIYSRRPGTPASDLPDDVLQSGDTLIVPLIAEGSVGVPASRGVQVFGGVGVPTTVPIQGPTDLVSVLMLAGAPLENARLAKVDWVHRDRQAATSVASRVDMRHFLEDGKASGNPLIYPGDVVYMHYQRPGWLERNLPLFLALVTTTTTALLAYDRLSE